MLYVKYYNNLLLLDKNRNYSYVNILAFILNIYSDILHRTLHHYNYQLTIIKKEVRGISHLKFDVSVEETVESKQLIFRSFPFFISCNFFIPVIRFLFYSLHISYFLFPSVFLFIS